MGDEGAGCLVRVDRKLAFSGGKNRHTDRLDPGKARFVPIFCLSAPAVKELRYVIDMMADPLDRLLQPGPRRAETLLPVARIPLPIQRDMLEVRWSGGGGEGADVGHRPAFKRSI